MAGPRVEHIYDDELGDCPCRPTVIPVQRGDGSIGWVFAHHEPDEDPAGQADRAVAIAEAMEQVRTDTDDDDEEGRSR